MAYDFFVGNVGGSILTLTPLSSDAEDWCADHLPEDAPMVGRAFAVEPRYLSPIVDGMLDAGLRGNVE